MPQIRATHACVLVGILVTVAGTALAQGLPAGPGPVQDLRRGANGNIEAVAPAAQAPGETTHYAVSAASLPAPNTTPPDDIDPNFVPRPAGAMPRVPQGFKVSVFAEGLNNPRWLAVAPNGDLFVTEPKTGAITVLRPNSSGAAGTVSTYASGFIMPHGIAFHAGALYVSDWRAIWRFAYRVGDTTASGAPAKITAAPDLLATGEHYSRDFAFDSKGRLFLEIGAAGDVAEEEPLRATIQEVKPDGTLTPFASGLRNAEGMEFYPGRDDLWITVNERDALGGNLPPDFLARVERGDFYGWPYAYIGPHPDPIFGRKRPDLVAKAKTPALLFEAHSAPLGLAFYDGSEFPADYKGDAFVALHATGPYGKPDGYKVVRVKFADGRPAGGYDDFLTGFWSPGKDAPDCWGTPVDVAVAKDGSLLVSDDRSRIIWRIIYAGS